MAHIGLARIALSDDSFADRISEILELVRSLKDNGWKVNEVYESIHATNGKDSIRINRFHSFHITIGDLYIYRRYDDNGDNVSAYNVDRESDRFAKLIYELYAYFHYVYIGDLVKIDGKVTFPFMVKSARNFNFTE